MSSCLALPPNAQVADILWCSLKLGIGNELLIYLMVFAFFIYGMYKLRMPTIPAFAMGLLLLFVLAGAGAIQYAAAPIFTSLMWVGVMVFGVVMFLAFWRLRR